MRLSRLRSQPASPARRPHAEPRPATPAETAVPPGASADLALEAERRLRAAGGPEDHATYACRCGAVFPAAPTTSVSCPLCGVHQAW